MFIVSSITYFCVSCAGHNFTELDDYMKLVVLTPMDEPKDIYQQLLAIYLLDFGVLLEKLY